MFGPYYQPKKQRGFVNSPQVNQVVIDAILFNKIFCNTGADFVLHYFKVIVIIILWLKLTK